MADQTGPPTYIHVPPAPPVVGNHLEEVAVDANYERATREHECAIFRTIQHGAYPTRHG